MTCVFDIHNYMSGTSLHKNASTQVENEQNNSKRRDNSDAAIHLNDERETEGGISWVDSKSFTCIDMEDTIEPPADKSDEIFIDIGKFVDLTGLKINVHSRRAPRRIFTVMGLYDNIFGRRQHHQQGYQRPRYIHQPWRQEPSPQEPQRTVWTQYGQGQGQQGGYSGYDGYGAYGYDGGGPLIYDPRSRNSFVALVMGIVFVMIAATATFLGVVLATPELKEFFRRVSWLIILPSVVGLITVNCALICLPCARRLPCNIICLIITTVSMSILAAKISSYYRTEIIFHAVITTGAVTFVCVLLACSKFDFTSYLLYIVVIATAFSVIVMIILISMMVTGNVMRPILVVILIIGTLIQVVMLTMQLQMILGGRAIEISEADYALAAFLIYTSILDIYLKLVQILGLLDH